MSKLSTEVPKLLGLSAFDSPVLGNEIKKNINSEKIEEIESEDTSKNKNSVTSNLSDYNISLSCNQCNKIFKSTLDCYNHMYNKDHFYKTYKIKKLIKRKLYDFNNDSDQSDGEDVNDVKIFKINNINSYDAMEVDCLNSNIINNELSKLDTNSINSKLSLPLKLNEILGSNDLIKCNIAINKNNILIPVPSIDFNKLPIPNDSSAVEISILHENCNSTEGRLVKTFEISPQVVNAIENNSDMNDSIIKINSIPPIIEESYDLVYSNTITIRNLSPHVTDADLKHFFGICGAIKNIQILVPVYASNKIGNNIATVEFYTFDGAKAGRLKSKSVLNGVEIKVSIRKYSFKLRVELPSNDSSFLQPTFSSFGEIENIELCPEYAIITFKDRFSAEAAIKSELIISKQKLILSLIEE